MEDNFQNYFNINDKIIIDILKNNKITELKKLLNFVNKIPVLKEVFLNYFNRDGKYIINLPLLYVSSVEMAKLLIENGADVKATNFEGDTVLHHIYAREPELIQLYIQHGVDINAKNDHGDTPLYTARNLDIAKEFVRLGADINTFKIEGDLRESQFETSFHDYNVKELKEYAESLNITKEPIKSQDYNLLFEALSFNYESLKTIYKQNDVSRFKKIIEQINILDPSKNMLYDLIVSYETFHYEHWERTYAITYAKSEILQLIVENITNDIILSIHYNLVDRLNDIPEEFIKLLKKKYNKIFDDDFVTYKDGVETISA